MIQPGTGDGNCVEDADTVEGEHEVQVYQDEKWEFALEETKFENSINKSDFLGVKVDKDETEV